MKITILATALLLSVIVGCIFSIIYTENITTDILDTLDMCVDTVVSGDWDLALDHISLTNSLWNKHKRVLSTFLMHEEIDNVSQALCRTMATVTEREYSEFMIESACLAELIEHISTLDYSNISNVF